ncbi:hypothetical protein [Halorussus aquaticus]|uniref:Uncharacterized protein n=1 Tax=Halorussus aquaticus TaxID=2953748 RepID=A0ABD5Q477_9EURY|nr:hypothetical protein [Halorussus aquaticus]
MAENYRHNSTIATTGESVSVKDYSQFLWFEESDDEIQYLKNLDSSGSSSWQFKSDTVAYGDTVELPSKLNGIDGHYVDGDTIGFRYLADGGMGQVFEHDSVIVQSGDQFSIPSETLPLFYEDSEDRFHYLGAYNSGSTTYTFKSDTVGYGDTITLPFDAGCVDGNLVNNGDSVELYYVEQ